MLTINDLRTLTPVVFSESPHPAVTTAYEFIPTLPLVETLLDRGWQIRSAHQNKRNDPYASHRVVFDVPGAPTRYVVGDVHPTATLYNSLNRTRRLSMLIGFYKTTCSNQAQISILEQSFDRVHLHGWSGVDFPTMFDMVMTECGNMATLFERMHNVPLVGQDREVFAQRALSIKQYGETKFSHLFDRVQAVAVLEPHREADRSPDLFTTYNVVQENLLHSGRGVNEVGKNRNVNLKLWELATTYLN